MTIVNQVQKLEPGAVVDLFKVDCTPAGGDILYFHGHGHMGSIWWKGQEYMPYPIKSEDFQLTTDRPPTPKLTVSNMDGTVSNLCYLHDDLVGSVVTRSRTLVAYLDAINFADPNIFTSGDFRDDVTGWTTTLAGGTWTWMRPGVARLLGDGTAYRDVTVVPGTQYLVKTTLINRIASASVKVLDGAAGATLATLSTPGVTNTAIVTPTTTTLRLRVESTFGAEISLSNLTVQKYIGNANADPTQEFRPEIWYIDRKVTEDNEAVTFELASAMDLNGIKLPRRQIIANYCTWKSIGGYRGAYCGYAGAPVAKADGTPTSDPLLDKCGGKLTDCELRQWPDQILGFGGYPAAGLVRV